MCYFISVIIPNEMTIEELNTSCEAFGISFQDCKNDFVKKQLKTNQKYLIKNCNHCECGTVLGNLYRKQGKQPNRIELRDLKKLEKKGWSKFKIQRWISDKKKAVEKNEKTDSNNNADWWVDFLKTIFTNTSIDYFGVLLHFYNDSIEKEEIEIKEIFNINILDLTPNDLLMIEDDCIYRIYR